MSQPLTTTSGPTVRHLQSPDGTEKLLTQLANGGRIECVLLRDNENLEEQNRVLREM
jgi:adenine C2-methylase RlmN of 23S rRNA A2503 and tRNA A37